MAENKKKTPWSITTNRFVCFLDIMGFKDMVMRNSHKDIYDILQEFSKDRETLENVKSLPKHFEADSLKTVSFSDSIVVFTKSDSLKCFELLSMSVSWLFATALSKGIPLKGAIALGEMSINSSRQIFFGQPLIDAYLLEEDVAFYGIVIHNTVEKFYNLNFKDLNPVVSERYKECMTPLKSGKISHKILDWVLSLEKESELEFKNEALLLMKKQREKTSGGPRKYIDNTIDVINQTYEVPQTTPKIG